MGRPSVRGQGGEMALLAKKVLFGAVRPSQVYPREVTLMPELGAAGCAGTGAVWTSPPPTPRVQSEAPGEG